MYGKVFDSIYDGTLAGHWEAIVTMQQLIVLATPDGVVDMTPQAIAARTTIPLDIITKGLKTLSEPDPFTRTPGEEGRRIVLLDDHRPWGWRLVNHGKYMRLRNMEQKRADDRARIADKRNKIKGVASESPSVANVAHSDSDSDSDSNSKEKTIVGLKPDVARQVEPTSKATAKRQARAASERAIAYLNEKAGTHFQNTEANLKLPMARMLYDNATEADLRAVVDLKVAEVARNEFDRRYLRPATLWNAEKFSQYVGQIGAQPPARAAPRVARIHVENVRGERSLFGEVPAADQFDYESTAREFVRKANGYMVSKKIKTVIIEFAGEQRPFSEEELRAH